MAVDQGVLDVDYLQVAAVLHQLGADVFLYSLFDLLGKTVGRDRWALPADPGGRRPGVRDYSQAAAIFAPNLVQKILQTVLGVVAGCASTARFHGRGHFRDGAEVELLDFASQVRLAQREALAYEPSFLPLIGVELDSQAVQIDPASLGPIEHGRSKGLGAHHRAVNLLLGQAFEIRHYVVILKVEGLQRSVAALLDQRA